MSIKYLGLDKIITKGHRTLEETISSALAELPSCRAEIINQIIAEFMIRAVKITLRRIL